MTQTSMSLPKIKIKLSIASYGHSCDHVTMHTCTQHTTTCLLCKATQDTEIIRLHSLQNNGYNRFHINQQFKKHVTVQLV